MKLNSTTLWIIRLIAAVILLQTLYFKFTAHPESVALFTKLGAEPWGRIGTGIIELITGIILLIPAYTRFGAVLAFGLMIGAISSHLLVIGFQSSGDGGKLFGLAIAVLICSIILLVHYRDQLIVDLNILKSKISPAKQNS
ncbi:MAG: DoxX family protein [Saprospiraceae bacterium]